MGTWQIATELNKLGFDGRVETTAKKFKLNKEQTIALNLLFEFKYASGRERGYEEGEKSIKSQFRTLLGIDDLLENGS